MTTAYLAGDHRDLLGTAVPDGLVEHEVVAVAYDAATGVTRLDYTPVPILLDRQALDLAGGPE